MALDTGLWRDIVVENQDIAVLNAQKDYIARETS